MYWLNLLFSLFVTLLLYIGIPLLVCYIIFRKKGYVRSVRTIIITAVIIFAVVSIYRLLTSSGIPNVVAAGLWTSLSIAIARKRFPTIAKQPDATDTPLSDDASSLLREWHEQAEVCKQEYPDFDFDAECNDDEMGDEFLALLQDGANVATAYRVISRRRAEKP